MGQTWFDRKAWLQSNDLFRLGSALDPGSASWRRSLLQGRQPARPASPDHATVTKYCVGCHNTKVKTSGLALDSTRHSQRGAELGGLGEGGPQAAYPIDATRRTAAAG